MTVAIAVVLLLAAAGFAYRLFVGPSVIDRVVGLNGLLLVGVAAIAAHAAATGTGTFLPVAVVITLVGFVGTAMVARFVDGLGG